MRFAEYAAGYLDAVAFEPDFEKADEQIFAASLNSFRDLLQYSDGMANAGGMPLAVQAGFVEKMTPNALADHHGGVHFIAMHQALMATIVDFCLFLFTQDCVFPNIGDAAGEASQIYEGNDAPGLFLLRVTMAGASVDPRTDHFRVPRDADRHVAAVYMSILMSRYVWLHELAHCENGHVLLLQQGSDLGRIHEVAEPAALVGIKRGGTGDAERALRYALEFDADKAAMLHLITVQLDGRENVPGLLAYDDLTRLEMALLGAFLMTWLFEAYQRFMNSMHGLTHPNPALRLQNLSASLRALAPELASVEDSVRARFNALVGRLPGLHAFDAHPKHFRRDDAEQLRTHLAPFLFAHVNRPARLP